MQLALRQAVQEFDSLVHVHRLGAHVRYGNRRMRPIKLVGPVLERIDARLMNPNSVIVFGVAAFLFDLLVRVPRARLGGEVVVLFVGDIEGGVHALVCDFFRILIQADLFVVGLAHVIGVPPEHGRQLHLGVDVGRHHRDVLQVWRHLLLVRQLVLHFDRLAPLGQLCLVHMVEVRHRHERLLREVLALGHVREGLVQFLLEFQVTFDCGWALVEVLLAVVNGHDLQLVLCIEFVELLVVDILQVLEWLPHALHFLVVALSQRVLGLRKHGSISGLVRAGLLFVLRLVHCSGLHQRARRPETVHDVRRQLSSVPWFREIALRLKLLAVRVIALLSNRVLLLPAVPGKRRRLRDILQVLFLYLFGQRHQIDIDLGHLVLILHLFVVLCLILEVLEVPGALLLLTQGQVLFADDQL